MSFFQSGISRLLILCLLITGCSLFAGRTNRRQQAQLVPFNQEDRLWETAVNVLHEFRFEIERENRQARVIETDYRVGSGILEPWHKDSTGFHQRMESTLQSIRRIAYISMAPADHGLQMNIVVQKEIEDLEGVAATNAGGATFQEATPFQRDLNQVVGQSRPSGWISIGRDYELESVIRQRILESLSGS